VDFFAIFQEKRKKISDLWAAFTVCRVKNRPKAIFGDYDA
jgi:hypothetical protein